MFIDFDRNSIISVQAVLGADPHESTLILNNRGDNILGQSVVDGQVPEPERLRCGRQVGQKEDCKNRQSFHKGTSIQFRWVSCLNVEFAGYRFKALGPADKELVCIDGVQVAITKFLYRFTRVY